MVFFLENTYLCYFSIRWIIFGASLCGFLKLWVGIWHTSDLELAIENLQSLLSISYSNVQEFFLFKDIQKSVLDIFKNNTRQTTSSYMFIELALPRQGE